MTVREWFRVMRGVQWHEHEQHQKAVEHVAGSIDRHKYIWGTVLGMPVPAVENRFRLDGHTVIFWNYQDPLDADVAICYEILRGVTTRRVHLSYMDVLYGVAGRHSPTRHDQR